MRTRRYPASWRIRIAFLLLAAALTCGCRSQHRPPALPSHPPVAPGPVQFHDVAQAAGISYRWGHASRSGLNILDTIGHGCAFLDYDGDGKLDILLVGSDHCLLYRNRGDGTFEDVTDRAFPGAPRRPTLLGCAVVDYDGDGRPDIFVTGY
ncbi:MAG TPA: VCBS repeat-containing protein, partial [Chthonomonadaceae bacterium]|nr:VCBS repeat-containing protein [Chthonomonadaceae bacterium]